MPSENETSAPPALSFERAEYVSASAGSVACSVCNASPKDAYFRCGQATLCARCAEEFRGGRLPARSGGLFRALGYGVLAAAGGSCVYYLISAVTGYEFGLIGILLGFAVGAAVRNGSGARGGWLYQLLAMLLIYLAIVSTYVPQLLDMAAENGPARDALEQTIRVVLAAIVSLVAPILMGLDNLFGLFILGIAMLEGWKINKRERIAVEGPFPLAQPSRDETRTDESRAAAA
jgi:hypothetical protein